MKLKDLLAEGRFDMEGPEPESVESEEGSNACAKCGEADVGEADELCDLCRDEDDEACPSCGRSPGDGYGDDCDDPAGCGHWKDWAREAAAEWKRDNKRDGGMDEGANFFDKYMAETLWIEDRRAKQLKAPVVAESIGKIRQKLVQETPANRIRIVRK